MWVFRGIVDVKSIWSYGGIILCGPYYNIHWITSIVKRRMRLFLYKKNPHIYSDK